MEKLKEAVLKSLFQIAAGIIIAVVSVAWTNKNSDNKSLRRDVDEVKLTKADKSELKGKVDNTIFSEYKIKHEKEHVKESLINKEFRLWLRKEMEELREDVRNIKK